MAHEWTFTWLLSAHAYGKGGRNTVCGDSQLSKLSDNRNRMGKEGGRGREDNIQIECACEAPKGLPLESVPSNSLDTLLHRSQCYSRTAAVHSTQQRHTAHSNGCVLTLLQESQDPKECLGHSNCSPSQERCAMGNGRFHSCS